MQNVYMPCPLCGEEGASVTVHISDLADEGEIHFTFRCCDGETSIQTIRTILDKWPKFLKDLEEFTERVNNQS